ncbi:MAG: xanthine dehydrogenase family protein molybdopterin-binding subunit [Christensenellaceae bacterium]|jgi:CO/xanthine dehydrogenase Mo-binding subunit|nr:xanthine dehydrogenase family protein molybdopterin-binding subunit [Christensenellaceae bacterium]
MPLYGKKQFNAINRSVPRIDGYDKVTGRARFAADLSMPDMVYGGVLRSGRSSAKVVHIDTSEALRLPGVLAVVTAADVEKPQSWASYMYITDRVRYVGDVVAWACAETPQQVREALAAIRVEYEELPAVYDMRAALEPGAPVVQEKYPDNIFKESVFHLRKGNVEKAFAEADFVIEREYETQYIEHAYIEPEAALAVQHAGSGEMTVYAAAQNPFFTRRYVADILGAPLNRVQILQQTLGGSFGGKEEGLGLLAARAAWLCRHVNRPVKMTFTREESFLESSKRHPFLLRYKAGIMKDGRIVAWEGTQIDNCGAYNNQTQFMNWRANAHSAGVYSIANVKTDTFGVFTNNVHGGAMRGYSSPQLLFAQEQFIDEIAEEIGLSEVEMRRINCLKTGNQHATGATLSHVTISEVMEHTLAETDYEKKRETYKKQTSSVKRRGIGMAICHRSCGFGAESPDASGAMLIANEDGSVLVHSGLAENGQGLKTAYAQIAAEALGVPYENVQSFGVDTHAIADCGMTVASRGTVMGAQSVRKAGLQLNAVMRQNAVELGFFADMRKIEQVNGLKPYSLDDFSVNSGEQLLLRDGVFYLPDYPAYTVPFNAVTGSGIWAGKQLSSYAWFVPEPCVQDHETGQGVIAPTFAYGCVVAEVEVDMRTGYVDVLHVTSSHDVGTAINPALIKGQIYGGIVMGQGFAVMEDVELHAGKVGNPNLDEYILPTAMDMPNMRVNVFECDDEKGTYGAKSVGEPATEAVGAAIANAVYSATGRRIRKNPAGLEQVLLGKKLSKG